MQIHKDKKQQAIWLFAGGSMQEPAAKKILEQGFKLILTDMDSHCVCARYADEFVECDTFDIEGNIKEARVLAKKYGIQAVFTVAADCHETVACVAKALGLHGIHPRISHLCRFKLETRAVLQSAGIPQPKWRKIISIQEARKTAKEIGFPVVIKSSNNSGSRGFSRIETAADITNDVVANAIEQGTTGYAIMEELLVPIENEIAEQSVETVWYNGKMRWLNWVDRLFRKDFLLLENTQIAKHDMYSRVSWAVELGHINPASHPGVVKEAVRDMIYRAGLAIGLDEEKGGHILKADIMLTKKGPYILELTPRLSGGWDSSCTTPKRGADFIGGAIYLALGGKLNADMMHTYFHYKYPEIFATILAEIDNNAKDCIGRRFALGYSHHRHISIENAFNNLKTGKFL